MDSTQIKRERRAPNFVPETDDNDRAVVITVERSVHMRCTAQPKHSSARRKDRHPNIRLLPCKTRYPIVSTRCKTRCPNTRQLGVKLCNRVCRLKFHQDEHIYSLDYEAPRRCRSTAGPRAACNIDEYAPLGGACAGKALISEHGKCTQSVH